MNPALEQMLFFVFFFLQGWASIDGHMHGHITSRKNISPAVSHDYNYIKSIFVFLFPYTKIHYYTTREQSASPIYRWKHL